MFRNVFGFEELIVPFVDLGWFGLVFLSWNLKYESWALGMVPPRSPWQKDDGQTWSDVGCSYLQAGSSLQAFYLLL